jgi:large subunit ribosomal protein L24
MHPSAARRHMVVPLSPEAAKQSNLKRIAVRKGDTVMVVKGDKEIRGLEGKVSHVDPVSGKVTIDGITITKADGKQTARPVHYSNLMITNLYQDKMRIREG